MKDRTCDESPFLADRLAVDCDNLAYLASSENGELWILSLAGEIVDVAKDVIPGRYLPLNDIIAAGEIVISGPAGIARVQRGETAGPRPGAGRPPP